MPTEKHQYSILMHIYGTLKDGNNNPEYETAKVQNKLSQFLRTHYTVTFFLKPLLVTPLSLCLFTTSVPLFYNSSVLQLLDLTVLCDLSSPTRDRTPAPCSGNPEIQPLDRQGSPWRVTQFSCRQDRTAQPHRQLQSHSPDFPAGEQVCSPGVVGPGVPVGFL